VRVEESGCDLELIGTLARTGYEQDESPVSGTVRAFAALTYYKKEAVPLREEEAL